MTINNKIRDEKMQHDIGKEAAKMSALPSGKIFNYEYLTSKEILPSDESRITKQAKFKYSSLGNALEKQKKAIEDQKKKQINAVKSRVKKNFFRHKRKINRLFVCFLKI